MDLVHGFRSKHHNKVNNTRFLKNTIRSPHFWILKVMARALLLALIIVSIISWLGSTKSSSSKSKFNDEANVDSSFVGIDSMNAELLPLLFHDLANEGLLKGGARALLVSDGNNEEIMYNSQILNDNEMDMISYSDSDRQSLVPDETFDFAFAHSFQSASDFIDRTLKVGGIAAVQLSDDPSFSFPKPTNYKIVYLRRFDPTIIAMRKTAPTDTNMPAQRRLFGISSEAKKEALKNLEDVLLEPPRAKSGKSKRYLKRTRYLPDLTGDSLESYPRRVFIHVGTPGMDNDARWFEKHYPTRNKDFDIYKIETVTAEEPAGRESGEEVPEIGMSEWLWENVNEDEYVVMKAEAEVVEEMVKSRAIVLVDELFMECKHQGLSKKSKNSRRAYWECLALYGKLRDEGVAVHQWWG
ncbi:uncharacterized protein LOC132279366 [Cornus florida]|uniref:uncharacterized protein LOC132279366 n=1 Tax=Cornus florida TaxID=4283 RepID=UPI0028A0DBBA|nr:uncharacterized protein LOC132279366 [Cornus florida]